MMLARGRASRARLHFRFRRPPAETAYGYYRPEGGDGAQKPSGNPENAKTRDGFPNVTGIVEAPRKTRSR